MNYAHTRVGAQKHTPRKRPRQGFGYKIGWVLGVSLLGRVKSGAFLVYPCAEMWNRAGFSCTRVGRKSIRPEMSCDDGLGVKSGGFWVYPYWGWVKSGAFLTYPGAEI